MTGEVAEDGGERAAGPYLVGYSLKWREPVEENLHVEIAVSDRADGRFVPALDVTVTPSTRAASWEPHQQPML